MFNQCRKCQEEALPDRKYCQKHLDYINLKARERIGKCKQCNEPAVDGKSRCAKHQEEIRIKSAERKAKLKAEGLCKDCGKKARTGKVLCLECMDKALARNSDKIKSRQSQGKCTCCGGEKENSEAAYCISCVRKDNERLKLRSKIRKDNGLCVACNIVNPSGNYLCFDCTLEYRVRINISNAVKRRKLSSKISFEETVGCSPSFFREHIKNLMDSWMNQENYGVHVPGEKRWQIGHRVPVASFDLTDPEQQKKCWHYTNLFPQDAKENICNGDLMFFEGKKIRGRNLLVD